MFADWTALAGASDTPDGAVITVDAHNAITLVGVTAVELVVHAMAGFGGGSGAGESLNTAPLGTETSQQALLTMPHA